MSWSSTNAAAREIRQENGRLVRVHPVARRIVAEWRRLSDSGRTVVACSGGADSSALVVALATCGADVVVAYVMHDLRPRERVLGERDSVRALAERFGAPLVEAEIRVGPGNAEGEARRLRYRALESLAKEAGARFVATGHHADDQLESVLMALIRGAGPQGLRGVAPKRQLGREVSLLRPMLGVTRADAEGLCEAAGVEWAVDETNADVSRLRAAIRAKVSPELKSLRPEAARKSARTAQLMRDVVELIDQRVADVFGDATQWPRSALRAETDLVIGAGLKACAMRLAGRERLDRIGARRIDAVTRAIRDDSTEPRVFEWPGGVRIEVRARTVRMSIAK